jgi:hypothetical protein
MERDIVERLREAAALPNGLYAEAATEIETTRADLAASAARVQALEGERDWWRGAAKALAEREAEYRKAHDLHGDSAMEAGRAWDLMRKQGDRIRAALTERPND